MKSFRFIKSNLLLGLILSMILTIAVIPFIHVGSKYNLTVKKNLKIDPNDIYIYKDIDHDGNTEKLNVIRDFDGRSSILFSKFNHDIFQWNLHGKIMNMNFLYAGDYNDDGVDELYVFTYSHDSIFLNTYDIKNNRQWMPPFFITKFKYFNGNNDINIFYVSLKDLKHNGKKELITDIHAGFSKSVRKVFAINLKNKTLRSSPEAGTDISEYLYFADLTGNGSDDIMGEIYAVGNYSNNPEYPYSDMYLWFYVYNANLQFLFPPVKLGHHPGSVQVRPIKIGNREMTAVYCRNGLPGDSTFIGIANDKGNFIRYRKINFDPKGNSYYFKVFKPGKRYRIALYQANSGLVSYFDAYLRKVKTYQSIPFDSHAFEFDLDGDGKKEEVYFGKDMDHLVVSRNDFKDPVVLKFDGEVCNFYFSEKWKNGKPTALCLNLHNKYYEFQYKKNPYYTYRYLIYGLIFLLIFLLVNLIGFYYQQLIKQRYKVEEKIRENQLLAIEMQLNPHFLLNLLNSIGSLYEKKETETARLYMGKYSKLLRETLLSSDKIAVQLKDELRFVRNYLELEQFRHSNKFTFAITCEAVDQEIEIPKLLIHTFVENALKHGIFQILGKEPAEITIECTQRNEQLIITITDNGIGRKESARIKSFSTGKGLAILKETLKLYQKIKKRKITFTVEDLNPEQRYTGTKVTILIQKKTDAN